MRARSKVEHHALAADDVDVVLDVLQFVHSKTGFNVNNVISGGKDTEKY